MHQAPRSECITDFFFIPQPKICWGAQKNRLNETHCLCRRDTQRIDLSAMGHHD